MIVRNLRLQRSWSQRQLAEISELSVRTIQRIEQGEKPGLESAMALASIFDVDISKIYSEQDAMSTDEARDRELEATGYVKGIKEFYIHFSAYAVLSVGSLIFWGFSQSLIVWGFFCWGLAVLIHGLVSFDKVSFLGPRWEKKLIEKRLGRKL